MFPLLLFPGISPRGGRTGATGLRRRRAGRGSPRAGGRRSRRCAISGTIIIFSRLSGHGTRNRAHRHFLDLTIVRCGCPGLCLRRRDRSRCTHVRYGILMWYGVLLWYGIFVRYRVPGWDRRIFPLRWRNFPSIPCIWSTLSFPCAGSAAGNDRSSHKGHPVRILVEGARNKFPLHGVPAPKPVAFRKTAVVIVEVRRIVPVVIAIAQPGPRDMKIEQDDKRRIEIERRAERGNECARDPDRPLRIPEHAFPHIVVDPAIGKIIISNAAEIIVGRRPRRRNIIGKHHHGVAERIDKRLLGAGRKRRTKNEHGESRSAGEVRFHNGYSAVVEDGSGASPGRSHASSSR